jgi:uncharacterized membrane protein YdjX (TVP38/TMEM64 family)
MIGRFPGVFVANLLGSQAQSFELWQWIMVAILFMLVAGLVWRYRMEIREKILGWLEKVTDKE